MKLSLLIASLQKALAQNGDVEIFLSVDNPVTCCGNERCYCSSDTFYGQPSELNLVNLDIVSRFGARYLNKSKVEFKAPYLLLSTQSLKRYTI